VVRTPIEARPVMPPRPWTRGMHRLICEGIQRAATAWPGEQSSGKLQRDNEEEGKCSDRWDYQQVSRISSSKVLQGAQHYDNECIQGNVQRYQGRLVVPGLPASVCHQIAFRVTERAVTMRMPLGQMPWRGHSWRGIETVPSLGCGVRGFGYAAQEREVILKQRV
jgi:hypothetical protein